MIIKGASARLTPRACSSIPMPATSPAANAHRAHVPAKDCCSPRRSTPPDRGVARAGPADDRRQCQFLRHQGAARRLVEDHRLQFPPARGVRRQHKRAGQGQRRRHRHHRLCRQAGPVRRKRDLDPAVDDDPSGVRGAVRGKPQGGCRGFRCSYPPGRHRPDEQGHPLRRGQRSGTARPPGRYRSDERPPRPLGGAHGAGLCARPRRDVRVPGRQLHPGPDPGSVPGGPGQRYGHPARRWRIVGDRAAP